jgi:hypothetical protein
VQNLSRPRNGLLYIDQNPAQLCDACLWQGIPISGSPLIRTKGGPGWGSMQALPNRINTKDFIPIDLGRAANKLKLVLDDKRRALRVRADLPKAAPGLHSLLHEFF